MSKNLLALSLVVVSASLYAEENSDTDTSSPSPLKTEVEFGYQAHSGNSDSESLNSRLEGVYTEGRHRHSGEWKFYKLNKNGKEDKRQSTYQLQSDYKLGPRTYLYANFKGIDSKYSAYFKDYTWSSGLGYQFSYTDDLKLSMELGPGYRHQKPNLDELDDDDLIFPHNVDEFIFRGLFKGDWKMLPSLSLSAEISIVSGQSNTRFDNEVSITNTITENIALKLTHSRQYLDRVPNNLSNTDTVISANLLVKF
ncbi:DUF481 domain-containing protein [Vibrio nigripulchritudo]|uniref:DUF481 domain-containing protein n=1 Tax=Vibrio nigripulchritudo TaxID=28173 RepID=UPI00248FFFBF|nr:DUF481 domain-containing protein [Vibrio nigripulchritudo]BDU38769.1 membrane protein [Vibrio nigripulchritudo]BDU44489.1 membrane protein [Vibrio nigripulchritudo]